jgi:hypothetical protein
MTMELDDLKTAWRELDRRLDNTGTLTGRLLKELNLDRTRTVLRRQAGLLLVELISGVVAALWVINF